ncbi:L,D-transpeptidase [Paenibacillus abyssi]
MAWYLLGKEYMLIGKEAKANYCFIQAGDVYEAFETKQHPIVQQQRAAVEQSVQQHREAVEQWERKRKRKVLLMRSSLLVAFLLLCVFIVIPKTQHSEVNELTEASAGLTGPADSPMLPASSSQAPEVLPGMTIAFVNGADSELIGDVLSKIIYGSGMKRESALAVRMEEEDGYRRWSSHMKVLLSANRSASGAMLDVGLHDAATCLCQPTDATAAKRTLRDWSMEQEQRWVLASAIYQYQMMYKRWPKELDELVRPYPANVLAGDSKMMKAMFPFLLKEIKHQTNSGSAGEPGTETQREMQRMATDTTISRFGNYESINLPQQPLEIVVDRSNHRLAVMSGDVIVRSYAVGLGGDKTPEGSFYISEKVKNPNGRDDGEFGSRGMTLSDTRYAIHGTNEPDKIGKDESLGCIRMGKEDVEELYDLVPLGTQVTIKSGGLPKSLLEPIGIFALTPQQDETNPGVIYRWLGGQDITRK